MPNWQIVLAAVIFLVVAILLLIILPKKLSFLLINGFLGLLALFLLSRFGGDTIFFVPVNIATAVGSFVLGLPGVALIIILRLFF